MPILLSVICKPDGVVMVFPTWANAAVGATTAAAVVIVVTRASAIRVLGRGKARIFSLFSFGIDRIKGELLFISTDMRSHRLFGGWIETAAIARC